MKRPRGQCSACRYRYRLRRDGTVQPHLLYSGSEAHECEGSGKAPRPFDPRECGECLEHRFTTPGLAEACASVGIEHGQNGEAMLWDYLVQFHQNGHREAA